MNKKRTNIGKAIAAALNSTGMTQCEVAKRANTTQTTITRLINSLRRPDTDTLASICNCWPTPETNVRILIEHLRDEVARAGHLETAVEMRPGNGVPHNDIAHMIAQIRQADSEIYDHLERLIDDVLKLIKSGKPRKP